MVILCACEKLLARRKNLQQLALRLEERREKKGIKDRL